MININAIVLNINVSISSDNSVQSETLDIKYSMSNSKEAQKKSQNITIPSDGKWNLSDWLT